MSQDAMTDAQLREWATHNQSHSAAARGVLRLLAEFERPGSFCRDGGHYFGGGQYKCDCGIHLRTDFQTDFSGDLPMRAMRFDGAKQVPIVKNPALDAPADQPRLPSGGVCKPFDGSTGLPASGAAGHKSESAQ